MGAGSLHSPAAPSELKVRTRQSSAPPRQGIRRNDHALRRAGHSGKALQLSPASAEYCRPAFVCAVPVAMTCSHKKAFASLPVR